MTKYVWLRNGQTIESSCEEIIEDLTPVGSLLKIASIQVIKRLEKRFFFLINISIVTGKC